MCPQSPLDSALAFDVSRTGDYTVRFAGRLWDVTTDSGALPRALDDHVPVETECAPAHFRIVDP